MREVYIVGAVRSPIGRRRGGLSTLHPGELLGRIQTAAVSYWSSFGPLSWW